MAEANVAFIGGSGLYDMDGLADREQVNIETPFGPPSDTIVVGALDGVRVAFLPRHGRGHRISPTELPARANIYALKMLGVERIVSISAVGSLKEHVKPLDVVVPDQLIDRTWNRASTFFGDGIVAHVGFAEPFCPVLSCALAQAARQQGVTTHVGGACVVIEGPQFSTRAESELYRSWGASIIGMTALPEAKLAREAEICYATLALVTDYDCWHQSEESVSVELVVENLRRNVSNSQRIIRGLVQQIPSDRGCPCASALKNAIITSPERIPESARKRLAIIVDRYLR
jgi:5'-methylthioadenosine phosphorylase